VICFGDGRHPVWLTGVGNPPRCRDAGGELTDLLGQESKFSGLQRLSALVRQGHAPSATDIEA
jgi:hypothetical protein